MARIAKRFQPGEGQVEFTDALDPDFQRPLSDAFSGFVTGGLEGNIPEFPGAGSLYDRNIVNQYFQDVFAAPAIRGLTGPHGGISRVRASAAGRGTFFSSGRQQQEGELAGDVFAGLAGQRANLEAGLEDENYQDFLRRDPFSGDFSKRVLNWLGTEMTVGFEEQPSPWPSLIGGGIGTGVGAYFGGPTGAVAGGRVGSTIGNLFS